MKSLLLSGTLALLCGCQDTLFETQPGAAISACDEHFIGSWRLLPADPSSSNDELFVIVEPGCKRWRFIEDGKDDAETEKTVHVAFAHVGDLQLMTVKNDEKHAANDADGRWRDGYLYLRYEFAGDTIRLHRVDDKRVAHWIVDGAIKGRTETITQSPGSTRHEGDLHNFVSGDRDEMARVALLDGIFQANGYYTLKPATTAEIFKPATNSPANSKP